MLPNHKRESGLPWEEGLDRGVGGLTNTLCIFKVRRHPWEPAFKFSHCNLWSFAIIVSNSIVMTDTQTCCRVRGKQNGEEMPHRWVPKASSCHPPRIVTAKATLYVLAGNIGWPVLKVLGRELSVFRTQYNSPLGRCVQYAILGRVNSSSST